MRPYRYGDPMRRVLALASLALAAALLAGCTAGSSQAPDLAAPAPMTQLRSAESGATDATVLAPDRDVITTGEVSLVVDEPTAAATEATRLVVSVGGHVDALTERPAIDGRAASATLTLRIPAERLDATLDSIKQLGTVQSVSLNRQDVTTQVKDVDARVAALQASVDRLTQLMATATTTADLIDIESALSQRQADLDGLLAQQKYLKDQVQLSTISLALHQLGTAAAGAPTDFWSGLVAGWQALGAAFSGFLVALGVALPLLAIVAVLGAVTWLVIWLVRRRDARAASRS